MSDLSISALVTGAGRGLGAELSKRLAAEGAKVVLVARHEHELVRVVHAIRDLGGDAHFIVADIGDKQATYALAGTAADLVGPIDLLVHNASTLGVVPLRRLLDTDCESLERTLAVNVVGPFRLTKAIAGSMVLRKKGTILQITSDASVTAYESWGAYGVSKAALDHFGRILGAELDGTGVHLVTVDPGEMNTKMHAEAIPDADPASLLDPATVADHLVALIRSVSQLPNGVRVELARWRNGA